MSSCTRSVSFVTWSRNPSAVFAGALRDDCMSFVKASL